MDFVELVQLVRDLMGLCEIVVEQAHDRTEPVLGMLQ